MSGVYIPENTNPLPPLVRKGMSADGTSRKYIKREKTKRQKSQVKKEEIERKNKIEIKKVRYHNAKRVRKNKVMHEE